MEKFYTIGAVMAVLGILWTGLAGAWLYRRWRGFVAGLDSALPPEEDLQEDENPHWLKRFTPARAVREFQRWGFQPGPAFSFAGCSGIRMATFGRPDEQLVAVLVHHPRGGSWMELCLRFEDGRDLTVSNRRQRVSVPFRPEREIRNLPGATLGQLLALVDARVEASRSRPRQMPLDGFIEEYLAGYRREMEWRREHHEDLSEPEATKTEIALSAHPGSQDSKPPMAEN